ncbi:MAG: hypothetical protein IJW78_04890 [Clostridia bacterium]|nr:hypothetical protein [Clostridia bacterium]
MNILSKDLDTLRKEHAEATAYAEEMTKASIVFTDSLIKIADKYNCSRKEVVFNGANAIVEAAFNYDFKDWEENKK